MQPQTVLVGGKIVIILFKYLVRFLVTVDCRPKADRGMVWHRKMLRALFDALLGWQERGRSTPSGA
jgi:hypothetical protein